LVTGDAAVSEWPPRWELTAPETHVLRHRGDAYRDEPFKLAVKELVARRVLRVERVKSPRPLGRKPCYALVDGPLIGTELAQPLTPVIDVYRKARRQSLDALRDGSTVAVPLQGVLVRDLAKAARKEFRSTERYRERHVAPALVDRGLLRPGWGVRGLRPVADYDWTAAGREADAQLSEWLALGHQNLSRWTAGDLARGAAYAAGAGAVVLLMYDLYPELEDLGRRLQQAATSGGDPGAGLALVPDGSHDLDGGVGGFDPAGFDLDLGGLGDAVGDFGGFGGCGGGGGGGCGGGGGGS
jgi:hypothetical protein